MTYRSVQTAGIGRQGVLAPLQFHQNGFGKSNFVGLSILFDGLAPGRRGKLLIGLLASPPQIGIEFDFVLTDGCIRAEPEIDDVTNSWFNDDTHDVVVVCVNIISRR